MAMEITFENMLDRGEKKIKIVSIKGVFKEGELPKAYFAGDDTEKCFMRKQFDKDVLAIVGSRATMVSEFGKSWDSFSEGEVISLEEKAWIIKVMKASGKRLYEINSEIRRLKKEWEGKQEKVVI